MKAREALTLALVLFSSASLFLPFLLKVGFGEQGFAPEFLLVLFASYAIGFTTARISKAIAVFLGAYGLAAILTVQLIRAPLDALMGTLNGDLAAIVVERNVLFTGLVVVAPLSFVFLVIGAYRGESARRKER